MPVSATDTPAPAPDALTHPRPPAAALQCISTVDVGGEVDSMLLASPYLMVGYHQGQEGFIKVFNTETGASQILPGHRVRCRAGLQHWAPALPAGP